MEKQKVIMYTTPTCVYCKHAKEFFKAHNVEYKEYDVASDILKRQEMITQSGQLGVPVIVIGDSIVVGFDEGKISELLGIK